VRAITASILCSTRQLKAAAAPATNAMPIVAATTSSMGGERRRREQHADHRREDDQRNDARLGQAPELDPDRGGCVNGGRIQHGAVFASP
jgi:hypothetical protein